MALKPPTKMTDEAKAKVEKARDMPRGDRHWVLQHLLALLRDAPIVELRRAGGATDACCRCATETLRRLNRSAEVFPLVLRCAREVHPADSATLWPLQATAVVESVSRSHYKLAASFAQHHKLDIDPKRTGITPKDFLEFHYYGGTALAGLERWAEAAELFQRCMELPGSYLSKLVVGAHAKWVLASTISRGSPPDMPSDLMSKQVVYLLQRANAAYTEFAGAYRNAASSGSSATEIARKAMEEARKGDELSAEAGKGEGEAESGAGGTSRSGTRSFRDDFNAFTERNNYMFDGIRISGAAGSS